MQFARPIFPLFLLLASTACLAQDFVDSPKRLNGIPLYRVYEESDIEDTSHAYFVATSPDNRVFFGNETGVHVFDGSSWRLIFKTHTSHDKIRSLYWKDGQIYAAAYNTIGNLQFDDEQGAHYRPFNDEALSSNAGEYYVKILENGSWLYFIGQRNIVLYDVRDGSIHSKNFDSWIGDAAVCDGRLYVTTELDGMLRLDDGEFVKLPAFAEFVGRDQIKILKASPGGKLVFVTKNGELHRVENERPVHAYEKFNYDRTNSIDCIEFLDDRRLVLSIPGQGIVLVDESGATLANLDRTTDYRWSAARKLHVDSYGSLWVMLNSSVGKILLDSPITSIDERLRPSLFYPSAHVYENELYLCANGKLFRSKHAANGQLSAFENALPDSSLAIALVLEGEDGLLVHGEGSTYLLADQKLTLLGSHSWVDRLAAFKSDPNLFLGVSSSKAFVFRRDGMRFEEVASIPHTAGLVNKIACSEDDVFWLEIGIGQVGKVWLDDGVPRFKLYTAEHGLPADWVAVWEHGEKVLLTESSGVYAFDPNSESFARTDELEPYFPRDHGPLHRVSTDPYGNIWASYNNFNYILWKQPDGGYSRDSYSLSHIGELFFNQIKFLENGDAALLTENEVFHIDASNFRPLDQQPRLVTRLLEVSDFEDSEILYRHASGGAPPSRFELDPDQRDLTIRVANTFSNTLKPPSFQYYLEGVSKDWSKWTTSNELTFANLDAGDYTLRIRSKIGELVEQKEISIPISISPTVWESPYSFLGFLVLAGGLLFFGYNQFARNLKRANEKLERLVAERTQEIERKSVELQLYAGQLTATLDELRSAQDQLMTTSRKAGMAEVATNVLHNVGNVLNSINVGVLSLAENLEKQRIDKLVRVVELIDKNIDNLGGFFTANPKGKAIPEYLRRLAHVLREDFYQYQIEVDCMRENIDHVKKVISTQQAHAKTVDVNQLVNIPDLVESAITMIMGDPDSAIFEVSRDYHDGLEIISDKHRILQMIANFIKNAKEAIKDANVPLGLISIAGQFDESREFVRISVRDNGVGISQENLSRVFAHGFTTKANGHGFGLHSCSNSAKLLGGDLKIESDGPGRGTIVTLTLPVKPAKTASARSPRSDAAQQESEPSTSPSRIAS